MRFTYQQNQDKNYTAIKNPYNAKVIYLRGIFYKNMLIVYCGSTACNYICGINIVQTRKNIKILKKIIEKI